MELLEYVLRKAAFPLVSPVLFVGILDFDVLESRYRSCRVVRPLDEPEDSVSRESSPWSNELEAPLGTEAVPSAGAKRPFLVGTADREPDEKRCFAFGAEATRRMKRVADAPMAFGESGPVREDTEPAE